MDKYTAGSRCHKCGFIISSVKYVRRGKYSDTLERTCTRCGYIWNETPLDEKKNDT